jgi:hypothetical protein
VIVTGPGAGTAAVGPGGITYTPAAGFETDRFRYVLQDAAGRRSAPAWVVVRLIDAVDDATVSPRGLPVPVDVLANDVATGATVRLVGAPSGGTVSAGPAPGRYVFTPGSRAAGTGSFRYGLAVGARTVDTAVVRIRFGAAPQAVDDDAETPRNTAVTMDLVANDSAAGGLRIRVVRAPEHGRIMSTTATSVVYAPDHGFVGNDGFGYALTDGVRDLSTADGRVRVVRVVTSTTTTTGPVRTRDTSTTTRSGTTTTTTTNTTTTPPAGKPPVAVDDSGATAPGLPVRIPVASNDSDGDGDLDPGSVTILDQPAHGRVVVGAGGLVTYTPDASTEAFTDTFTYQIADATGAKDSATVTVRIGALEILQVSAQTVLPGQRIDVTGSGCQPGEAVRFSVDGSLRPPVAARSDGSFQAELEVGEDVGRHHVRATCNGRAFDSPVDVVQMLASGDVSAASAAVGLLATVAGLLAFYLLTGSLLGGGGGRSRRRRG